MKFGYDPTSGKMLPIREFQPRFVRSEHLTDLSNLWHLSRVACSDVSQASKRYKRLLWASGEFAKLYPYVPSTGVYKDLTDMLEFSEL